jgi:Putative restriction endonuclease
LISPDEEWQKLARADRFLEAFKVYRACKGVGLIEAMDCVKSWFARNCLKQPESSYRLCCDAIARLLRQFISGKEMCLAATWVRLSADAFQREPGAGPDVALWHSEEGIGAPALAVHVVLPNDTYSEVQRRARHFFEDGARMVWLPTPELRTVVVYYSKSKAKFLREGDMLPGEDVLPGFSCKVADLFG